MDFPTWLASQPRGTRKRLERDHGCSYTTLCRALAYIPISPRTAKGVSAATGGAVSPEELSFPPPKPAGNRKRKKRRRPNSELGGVSA